MSNKTISRKTKYKLYKEFLSYNLSFKKPTFIFMYSPEIDKVCLILNEYLKNKEEAINSIEVFGTYNKFAVQLKALTNEEMSFCYEDVIDLINAYDLKIEKYFCGFEEFNKKHPNSGYKEFTNQFLMKTLNEKEIIKMTYIALYLNHPFVEQLVKCGFEKIIFSFFSTNNDIKKFLKYFKNGNNINDITGLNSSIWKILVEKTININDYFGYVDFVKRTNIDDQQLERIFLSNINPLSLFEYFDLNDENFRTLSIKELLDYLSKVIIKQGLFPKKALSSMTDYLRMCKEINIKPNLKSKNLLKDHDEITNIYNKMTAEEKKELTKADFKKRKEHLHKYLYEDDRLMIVIPTDALDLYSEGKNNHNCVASYSDKHASGKTSILFVRKKDNPQKSYITLEFDENKKEVIQAKYDYNQKIEDSKDKEFITNWLSFCVNNEKGGCSY